MYVSADVTQEDYDTLHKHFSLRYFGATGYNWSGWIVPIVAAAFLFLVVAATEHEVDWLSFIAGALTIGTLNFYRGVRLRNLNTSLLRDTVRVLLGPQSFRLTESAFEHESTFIRSVISWPAIFDVAETTEHVFVLGKTHGFVVPKRAFHDATAAREFFKAAQTFHRDAKENRGVGDASISS